MTSTKMLALPIEKRRRALLDVQVVGATVTRAGSTTFRRLDRVETVGVALQRIVDVAPFDSLVLHGADGTRVMVGRGAARPGAHD